MSLCILKNQNQMSKLRKSGPGHKVTDLQQQFLDRVSEEGISRGNIIANELGYTNYYRDRKNQGTAFHKELMGLAKAEEKDIEKSKAKNLDALMVIRDLAIASGNNKDAIKAIEVMNKMQGYDAPIKQEKVNTNVEVVIDLTKPPEQDMLDIEIEEIE